MTSAMQQKTLQQLSTGLRINSSADDSAGLSISTGIQANIAALVQSQSNANDGIGFLQVADGALTQVGGLLNRAVTLATEAASGGLTSQQRGSANTEYQSILGEINQIGAATEFNGTQVFTNGNTSPASLTSGGAAIAGTINPADTLSGGFDVTSTIPRAGGTTTGVTVTDSGGTSASATITPGAALSGSLTVTSTRPQINGVIQQLGFTASSDGSTITSDQIITDETLGGNLVIDSTGGNASGSYSVDLSQYQGLASSDATAQNTALSSLQTALNNNLGATTGSAYTATLSGGVLSIQTSNPAAFDASPVSISFSDTLWAIRSYNSFYTGDTLAGSLTFTSTFGGGAQTINFANYQGLTSSNAATQNAALNALGSALDSTLGVSTGSDYVVTMDQNGELLISSDHIYERFQVTSQNITETPTASSEIINATASGDTWNTINPTPANASISGTLKLSATGSNGSASVSIDMSSYSDILGNDINAMKEQQDFRTAISNALGAATGDSFNVTTDSGGNLMIQAIGSSGPGSGVITDNGSTLQYTLPSTGESLSVGGTSNGTQAAIVPAANVQTTVDLAGQTTSTLQSYLRQQLGSDYTVSYNKTSGALSILLNNGNLDRYMSFATSGSPQQTVGGSSPVTATTAVSLAGLTKTNLASSLLSQLGSDYTVSYDQTTGALSIGISTAGASAGITSIASSNNTVVQTAASGQGLDAFDVFTGDGTTDGGTSLDVTVGVLTSASVGTNDGNAGQDLSSTTLTSQTNAASALALITAAINDISSQRGTVGANINRLSATASAQSTAQTNLTSAVNSIVNADIGKTVANMTQYNVLQSTGMAALQQANQAQQAVLKLIQ